MKYSILAILLFFTNLIFAQKPCEYSANVKDSLGTYKSTKEYMMYERNFGGNISYIFCSMASTDGLPTLSLQMIQKSKGFIKANCFDKNSKMILQLGNGKIISLLHIDKENCGTLMRDPNGFDNRILIGTFLFIKGTMEDLKSSPINLMRIKSLTGIEDFVIKKEFTAEMNKETYYPETYFMDSLHCLEN